MDLIRNKAIKFQLCMSVSDSGCTAGVKNTHT